MSLLLVSTPLSLLLLLAEDSSVTKAAEDDITVVVTAPPLSPPRLCRTRLLCHEYTSPGAYCENDCPICKKGSLLLLNLPWKKNDVAAIGLCLCDACACAAAAVADFDEEAKLMKHLLLDELSSADDVDVVVEKQHLGCRFSTLTTRPGGDDSC